MSALSPTAREVVRCWAGFASLGAGLVQAALVLGAVREGWVVGVFVGALAGFQLVWGLAALARETLPVPRLALVAAMVTIVASVAATTTTTAGLILVAIEVLLLWLVTAGWRSQRIDVALAGPERPIRRLALLAVGAFAMSGVVTPALAATTAGEHAKPHFHQGETVDGPPEGHSH